MDRQEIEAKVKEFLIEDLEIDEEKIQPEARLKEDIGIDSLDFVDIVVIVEKKFGFKIKTEEMANVKTTNGRARPTDCRGCSVDSSRFSVCRRCGCPTASWPWWCLSICFSAGKAIKPCTSSSASVSALDHGNRFGRSMPTTSVSDKSSWTVSACMQARNTISSRKVRSRWMP